MPLRTRLFIVISLVVLLVLAVSLVLVINSRRNKARPAEPSSSQTPAGQIIDQTNFDNGQLNQIPAPIPAPAGKVATPVEVEQNTAKQFAKIFIERFGSYSSDSNFQNVKDVQALVTPSLWRTLSKTIGAGGGAYVGVTTEALNASLSSWNSTTAVITIKTRETTTKNGATTVAYRDATITMVKTGDSWLVDSYSWAK